MANDFQMFWRNPIDSVGLSSFVSVVFRQNDDTTFSSIVEKSFLESVDLLMQPTQLGPYTINSRIGRGGMGAVYQATDCATGEVVAVKVLASHFADEPSVRRRFEAEIETLKSLRHRSIVQLLAFGEHDGQLFFAMELVKGKSLEQVLRDGRRFDWRETLTMASTMCRALKAAHDHGVVHRDLKPANLLLAEDGTLKLADFGIAKLFGTTSHTAQGSIVGTAEYMAPEQASGKPTDHRADLYALGLVMFAMLSGQPPFRGGHITEIVEKQRHSPPPRIGSLVVGIPTEFEELIQRLLSKDPSQRPASALALGRLLAAIETIHAVTPAADHPRSVLSSDLDETSLGVSHNDAPITSGASGFTDPDRSQRPTSPHSQQKADAQSPHMDASPQVDLYGETRELISRVASAPVISTGQGSVDPTRLPTSSARFETHVDRISSDRFTTIEQLERSAKQEHIRNSYRERLFSIVSAIAIAATVGVGAYMLLRPMSSDQLFDSILLIARDPDRDLRDASESIFLFLARHPADPRAAEVSALADAVELDQLERRTRRNAARPQTAPQADALERDYRLAMSKESHSPSSCAEALEAILLLNSLETKEASAEDQAWITLVQRQRDRLRPHSEREIQEDTQRLKAIFSAALALSLQGTEDSSERQTGILSSIEVLQGLITIYHSRPHAAEAITLAKDRITSLQAGIVSDVSSASSSK